jgi:hypothetical protein
MSGPKGGSYQIVSAAELARRRLRAAESAESETMAQLRSLEARCAASCDAYGLEPLEIGAPPRAARGDAEAIERWVEATRAAMSAAEAALAPAVADARSARVSAALSDLAAVLVADPGPQASSEAAPQRRSEPTSADDDAWREEVRRSVERSLRSLDLDGTADEVAAIEALAEAAVTAPSKVRGRQLAEVLGNDVGRANRAATARRERTDAVRSCLERLGAWEHPATSEARRWILAELGGPLPTAALVARAEAAVAEAASDRDRELVAASVRRSLQSFGYVVEEGFETLVVEDGVAYVRRADWSDHAVAVRLFAGRPRVAFNVVSRTGPVDAVRNTEIEREWCAAVDQIESALVGDGVVLDLADRTPAGEVPVQLVADDRFPFATRSSGRRSSAPKKKELER